MAETRQGWGVRGQGEVWEERGSHQLWCHVTGPGLAKIACPNKKAVYGK